MDAADKAFPSGRVKATGSLAAWIGAASHSSANAAPASNDVWLFDIDFDSGIGSKPLAVARHPPHQQRQ
jgi:hypothetical protein